MSQVHYENLSLEEAIRMAELILVVKKAEPFLEKKSVKIGQNPPKECSDFLKTAYHFVVVERLDTAENGPKPGEKITAVDVNFSSELEAYKLFCLENINKSPIYRKYETKADLLNDTELILFVSFVSNGEYLFSAYESPRKIEEIRKILKTMEKSAQPLPDSQ
jgi:hypothetical protein